jgi:diguanylate cyclase
MKTLRIVILEDETSSPEAAEGWPSLDLRQLEGLSGHDAADLLREHARATAFVDTTPDALVDLPDLHRFEADLQEALHATLQTGGSQPPQALLMGSAGPRGMTVHATPAAGAEPLPFERLNRSLVRALRRHELEAALAESRLRLRRMDTVDPSGGMPSRELFLDRLEQAAAAVTRGGVSFAILLIGVDLPEAQPTQLSDRTVAGLLQVMGERLVEVGRRSDSCARLGGHSFAALLPGNHTVGGAMAMAHKVARALGQPVRLEGQMLYPRPAVGVALCPQHGTDARHVLLHAHAAMEQAQQTRDGVALFDARLQRSLPVTPVVAAPWSTGATSAGPHGWVRPDDALAPLLADALERREFSVAYQPVMLLRESLTCSTTGCAAEPPLGMRGRDLMRDVAGASPLPSNLPGERADDAAAAGPARTARRGLRRLAVLPRWHTAGRGHVAPAVFMPVAEHHALISALTDQLIDLALSQARAWREKGWIEALSMPLSAAVLQDADFPQRLERLLAHHAWPAPALLLEITAAALAQPGAMTLRALDAIARLGVRLSVQDLGSPLRTGLALAERGALVELRMDLASLDAPPAAGAESAPVGTSPGAPLRPPFSPPFGASRSTPSDRGDATATPLRQALTAEAPAAARHSARDAALVRSALLLAQALGVELLVSGVADLATPLAVRSGLHAGPGQCLGLAAAGRSGARLAGLLKAAPPRERHTAPRRRPWASNRCRAPALGCSVTSWPTLSGAPSSALSFRLTGVSMPGTLA